ncbi:DUF29 domain-containing protein [Phormidium sp. LEGE 05292]|uniref:DUF29 domain-containing protein n=1 Tax=[Phormidium] sp. LEGE 05292 TaxID=767427 RepID=UPI00187F2825|nr:DUF29 domain-containing protein [Phormidium sp. LEGE 05292]MBE9224411.1 DUF29 domain-containing protein [Phormidium sp. LEGE 05292]
MNSISKTTLSLYKTDFVAWTEQTVKLINAREFSQVDWEAVVEEIESLGKSDRRELKSRLEVLLQHLLKWQYQSNLRSSSWQNTIDEQRNRILDLLTDSPSLQPYLSEVVPESYHRGKKAASNETKLPINTFPVDCPYSIDEILDSEFLPEAI